ncbi:MAG: ABC transporter ATP-binding protein [Candidatus Hodarchaeota archaeon]
MQQILLELENVNQHYTIGNNTINALTDITLTIQQGEFVVVMGPSGSGKSTLLNVMAGLERSSSGAVRFHQANLAILSDPELSWLRRHQLGFVFQFFNLHPVLSALENVELPMLISGVKRKHREPRALELLKLVKLEKRKYHLPHELSGGEKQRIGIARALANDPVIILADEATGDLDSATGQEIMGLLIMLNHIQGKTIICVTHDDELLIPGMRLIKMEDGRIISDSYL